MGLKNYIANKFTGFLRLGTPENEWWLGLGLCLTVMLTLVLENDKIKESADTVLGRCKPWVMRLRKDRKDVKQ